MAAEELHNYERVSIYRLNADDQERLLSTQTECVFNWCNADGHPLGVIMSYVWREGCIWLTAGAHRHRISAVRRNPKVSVVITSKGTDVGPGKSITIKGECRIHEDRKTKAWFYPALAGALRPVREEAEKFASFLDSPLRVVLEVIPEKWITYDGAKMWAHTEGLIDERDLAEPLEVDTERLAAELKRRGLDQVSTK